MNVAALLEREAFQQADKSILGLIEAACAKHSKLSERLFAAQPVAGTQAAVAPVNLTRKPFAWDMFPRLGDAAMMLPPLCGDGMFDGTPFGGPMRTTRITLSEGTDQLS